MLHSHFFLSAYITISPKNTYQHLFFVRRKNHFEVQRGQHAVGHEWIDSPSSPVAWRGLFTLRFKGVWHLPKKRVVFLVMDGFGKFGLLIFLGCVGCLFFCWVSQIRFRETLHVQETKPRKGPPVFEQSGWADNLTPIIHIFLKQCFFFLPPSWWFHSPLSRKIWGKCPGKALLNSFLVLKAPYLEDVTGSF